MTVLPWPPDPNHRPQKSPRKLIIDPLPQSILHSFVADLPGPKDETETARAARFEAQLAEVLTYNPRDSAEAMMATHCVVLRLLADDSRRDAARPGVAPGMQKKFLRQAKEFDQLIAEMKENLASRQTRPPGKMDPALGLSLGLGEFLIPDPDDPEQAEEAFSAVIVPLHPAPKMLQ
jgi:hypothetical protein